MTVVRSVPYYEQFQVIVEKQSGETAKYTFQVESYVSLLNDFKGAKNKLVKAKWIGTVSKTSQGVLSNDDGYGNLIRIDHDPDGQPFFSYLAGPARDGQAESGAGESLKGM